MVMQLNNLVIDQWQSITVKEQTVTVLPDGCRDLILRTNTDGSKHYFVSPFFHTAKEVFLKPKSITTGFRLAPGSIINESGLLANLQDFDEAKAVELINHFSTNSERVQEALRCIEQTVLSVKLVAKELGAHPRTLQRLMLKETGLSPSYWLRLSRIRKAGRLIGSHFSLTEIALDCGYSDHSHMTRECVHWFGVSPKRLRARTDLIEQLNAPAFS